MAETSVGDPMTSLGTNEAHRLLKQAMSASTVHGPGSLTSRLHVGSSTRHLAISSTLKLSMNTESPSKCPKVPVSAPTNQQNEPPTLRHTRITPPLPNRTTSHTNRRQRRRPNRPYIRHQRYFLQHRRRNSKPLLMQRQHPPPIVANTPQHHADHHHKAHR